MNDSTKVRTPLKFQSKHEIADCIRALTPFTFTPDGKISTDTWALEKIKALSELL